MSDRYFSVSMDASENGARVFLVFPNGGGNEEELEDLLDEADIQVFHMPVLSVSASRAAMGRGRGHVKASSAAGEALGPLIAIVEAAGGFGGLAAVLKVLFTRNKFKKVRFGKDGDLVEVEGLGVNEITSLLDSLSARILADTSVENAIEEA